MKFPEWRPTNPVSSGATQYHNAVANAAYYLENLKGLADLISPKIKRNNVVVDFGAGTGISSISMLKNLNTEFDLWLVDNSPSWLGKAYEILSRNPRIKFFLLQKENNHFSRLDEVIGKKVADVVVSANTIHLIPDWLETFKGIHSALKYGGYFAFQSGSIIRTNRDENILMVDDTVKRVHDMAINLIKEKKEFEKYRQDLDEKVEKMAMQRQLIFPNPSTIESYLKILHLAGFKHEQTKLKLIKILYADWLNFLRVKRLQAGILPEIGGKEPSIQEEIDRDTIIIMASKQLFKELGNNNPLADKEGFIAEWVYIGAFKI